MYVSSLSSGGLRALLLAFPFAAIGNWLFWGIERVASDMMWGLLRSSEAFRDAWLTVDDAWWFDVGAWSFTAGAVTVLMAALLWLASSNHGSAEHGATLARRQLPWLAVGGIAAAALVGAAPFAALWAILAR
jgi:hypothetical protein